MTRNREALTKMLDVNNSKKKDKFLNSDTCAHVLLFLQFGLGFYCNSVLCIYSVHISMFYAPVSLNSILFLI